MIKQIHMCEFVENNWAIETCTVYIICMNSYNQVLSKRLNKFVCLGPTPIVTNDDINWYVVTRIVEDWTIRMYDFVWRKSWPCLYKFIQPCCWVSIAHVWMRQMETVWCEFYPTKTNYDKEVPQEKCCKRKKPSAKIHLLIQVSELWKNCQSDAVSHRTNQCQWQRTDSQQWLEIKNLAIRKTYTNWYNWNWN